jgi:nitrate reductase NapE
MDNNALPRTRKKELLAFLFLTIAVAPALSVLIVGGYGLVVWLSQLVFGPPGPPPPH